MHSLHKWHNSASPCEITEIAGEDIVRPYVLILDSYVLSKYAPVVQKKHKKSVFVFRHYVTGLNV